MRVQKAPSEIGRLAVPLAHLLDAGWQRMHWWVAAMALLYALSGITVVKSDERALILRWGRLVGATSALQEHGPGLLFSFPRPIDEVVRVPVKRVAEVAVSTLMASDRAESTDPNTLDPLTQGYAITGDHNIVHVDMVARYRIRDTAEWAFYSAKVDQAIRVEITAAMVRSLGEMGIDRVLADGRKELIATATRRAQAGLDAAHSGLEISSLELTRLSPPRTLAGDFDAVQSAFIEAETKKKEAQAFAEGALPEARAEANTGVQSAQAEASSAFAAAQGEADAFRALDREYRASPAVVRERLYRDAVERALAGAAAIRWVPPPIGGRYHGFRITVGQSDSTGALSRAPEEER